MKGKKDHSSPKSSEKKDTSHDSPSLGKTAVDVAIDVGVHVIAEKIGGFFAGAAAAVLTPAPMGDADIHPEIPKDMSPSGPK